MRKKKKVYFKGHYGFENLGDDIFTVAADWICNKLWKDVTPFFIGPKLPLLSNKSKKYEIQNPILKKLYEFFICLRVSNIIHFGGSVRVKLDGSIRDYKHFLYKFSYFHSKLSTIGTGLGPYTDKNTREVMKNYLSHFKFILVRGYSSISYLEDMKLGSKSAFCFDLAILIDEIYPKLKQKKAKKYDRAKVGVSLCRYESFTKGDIKLEEEREASVLKFIDNIVNSNNNVEEIVLFEFNGNKVNGDSEVTQKCYDMIGDKVNVRIVKYTSDTEKFCKELNDCDFIVGMRLHSAILSYSLNIPFLLVEYHPKCTEFLDTINHKYRYKIDSLESNMANFKLIMNNEKVPGIKETQYFKEIMVKELKRVRHLL